MFLVAMVAFVVLGVVARLLVASSGAAGRLARRLRRHLRGAWTRSDVLGRVTQACGYAGVAMYLLTPADIGTSAWPRWRTRALIVLAGLTVLGTTALLARRLVRRIRRSVSDEYSWTARELMYADASRENLAVLCVDSEQYRTPVGQRCWTVREATGDMEDTWFAGQWFPVGSIVLCDWTEGGSRKGVRWLTPSDLVGASRRDERLLRRRPGMVAKGALLGGHANGGNQSVVAEAEAILRTEGREP